MRHLRTWAIYKAKTNAFLTAKHGEENTLIRTDNSEENTLIRTDNSESKLAITPHQRPTVISSDRAHFRLISCCSIVFPSLLYMTTFMNLSLENATMIH